MEINEAIEKEARKRNYSPRTIASYQFCVERFIKYCRKEPKKITKKDIREFLNRLAEKGKSGNTINVYLNALKFVFEDLLGKKMHLDIRYSKKSHKLPVFLGKEETKRLIDNIQNNKHRLMISVMYSAGLRVSELTNLKVRDLELDKGYGFVRQGKGHKDRIFIIAKNLEENIRDIITKESLEEDDYLFNTNRKTKYSTRSLQEIVKKAAKKAKINKRIHPHTLRHSFATHLIENGSSLTDVQTLLGHKSPETSMIYVHMASPSMLSIRSPFDTLETGKNAPAKTQNQGLRP